MAAGAHHDLYARTEWDDGTVFRILQEEHVWEHAFRMFEEARRTNRDWDEWYNQERRHWGVGVSESGPIPGSTNNTDELNSSQHDMAPPATRRYVRRNHGERYGSARTLGISKRLDQSPPLQIIRIDDRSWFGREDATFLQQALDVFSDQV